MPWTFKFRATCSQALFNSYTQNQQEATSLRWSTFLSQAYRETPIFWLPHDLIFVTQFSIWANLWLHPLCSIIKLSFTFLYTLSISRLGPFLLSWFTDTLKGHWFLARSFLLDGKTRKFYQENKIEQWLYRNLESILY